MSTLSKIFDSLNVVFYSANMRENIIPVHFNGIESQSNYLVQLNQGNFYYDHSKTPAKEGTFYLRPAGNPMELKIGDSDDYHTFDKNHTFTEESMKNFQRNLNPFEDITSKKEVFTAVVFEVLLHNTIPFFKILQLPRIPLPYDVELSYLMRELCIESYQDKIGKQRLIKNYIEEIVIHICRHMSTLPEVEVNFEKMKHLSDKRLTNIIQYVNENINMDLSNKTLAKAVFLSEDYIGQFFKSLTNTNLQDYVENQRLDLAFQKLKTSNDSIQEIAYAVGFKDPAYFSRRFKMKFNVNANTLRGRE